MLVHTVEFGEKLEIFPHLKFFVHAGDAGNDRKFGVSRHRRAVSDGAISHRREASQAGQKLAFPRARGAEYHEDLTPSEGEKEAIGVLRLGLGEMRR